MSPVSQTGEKKEVTIKGSLVSFGLGVHEDPSGCQVDRVLNAREYSGNAGVGGPSSAEGLQHFTSRNGGLA